MNQEDKDLVPPYSKALVEQLDKMIPHRCPSPKMNERDIWIYAGKRELIDHLLSKLEYTEQETYQTELR